ncbi:MAG: NUDIX hydrolase [Candidatus Eisenbacteria sp.]|nr:NUDIX hydrolase [Candidatus Eisenbacteria bacterium]
MIRKETPRWLEWAREIQAMGQTGLAHSPGRYDEERYRRLMEIAVDIVHSHTDLSRESLLENFLKQPGYATPKIDVRGAVVRDGRILLVQEAMDKHWCMPGGWAEVGECPSESVERETWEESGFEVKVRKVVGVYDANRAGSPIEFYHAFKVVFLCEISGGEARPSSETLAVDFFSFDDLPQLSSQRTNERHLADVRAHCEDPGKATAFD